MDIFEVEGVCSILGDVLQDAVDIVESVTSICIVFAEFLTVDHLKVRLYFGISMDPDVNKGVDLFDWVFPESGS